MAFGLETGDLVLVTSKKTLSQIINKVMEDYAKQEGIDTTEFLTYSHAMTALRIEGDLYVAEAVENGFRIRLFDNHYSLTKSDLAVFRPKVPYSFEEKAQLRRYAMYLQEVNNFYEYWALILFLPYVYCSFKWKGKRYRLNLFGKGNKFSVFCYEGSYRLAKNLRKWQYPKNEEPITCYDLQIPEVQLVYVNIPD